MQCIRNDIEAASGSARLILEKSILRTTPVLEDTTASDPIMVTHDNPPWELFARSWKPQNHQYSNDNNTDDRTIIWNNPLDISMYEAFDCTKAHDLANTIWKRAYPNLCARCAKCGVCRHGQHRCGCRECTS
jgi:hypothetical protein